MCLYGGVEVDATVQTPEGFTQLGTDTMPPLLARGVLLDCADADHAVGADDLERAAEGLEIVEGDVILVRTGTGALWGDPEAFLAAGGIDASGSRWCAEQRPLAVGADIWQSTYLGSIASACQVARMGNVPLTADELIAELAA